MFLSPFITEGVASNLRSDRLLKTDSAIIICNNVTLRCPVMLSRRIIYERSSNFQRSKFETVGHFQNGASNSWQSPYRLPDMLSLIPYIPLYILCVP